MKLSTFPLALALALALALSPACSNQAGDIVAFDIPADIPTDVAAEATSLPETTAETTTPDAGLDLSAELSADLWEEQCNPGEGCFLDPCTQHGDCQSGLCVQHMGDTVCSMQCFEECPAGWQCTQIPSFEPDIVFACVSSFAQLCRPCATGDDCAGEGTQAVCVQYPDEGWFCGATCEEHPDCPAGFACLESQTAAGATLKQCVNADGVCPCSQAAVELGLTTPCQATNEWGTCSGERTCTDQGLSDCSAQLPAQETCDGLDNNCDGNIDENTCDDQNPCTQDACTGADGCANTLLDGTTCDDKDPCSVTDHCENGLCTGTPVQCDDGNPCTDDSCDGDKGCQFAPNNDACDDSDPCTVADMCKQGACTGTPVSCDCQKDSDCLALDDSNPCNGKLFCDISGLPYQCKIEPDSVVQCPVPEGPDGACLVSLCNPATGSCETLPGNQGLPCNDGDACTFGDVCQDGVCSGPLTLDCSDGNPCTKDSCNPSNGCGHSPIPGSCDDGNPCTTSDQCVEGKCKAGGFANCDDGNVCTDDYCDPAQGCVSVPNTAPCNDGSQCTVADSCLEGVCKPGATISCNDQNPCTNDNCLPQVGCTHTNNNEPCDDQDPCSTSDSCSGGGCLGVGFQDCDDGNPCTTDFCNPMLGCDHNNNKASCDDGNVCTVGDKCSLGKCQGGAPVSCNDGNPCTADSCDKQSGCTYDPLAGECDDLNQCTTGDQCINGVCMGQGAYDCDDDNPCTLDICLPQGGCSHENLPGPCSDNDPCTVNDQCLEGKCTPGPQLVCNDGNACTQDGCGPGGCQYEPLTGDQCDDGNECTSTDACVDGKCAGTGAVDCDDDNICTTNYCDPGKGCVQVLNNAPCDDGDVCTLSDTCQLGECIGAAMLSCQDSNACTTDSCDPQAGCQFIPVEGQCNDGISCTIGDHCVNGQCLPTAFDACDDENPCTDDTCDFALGCRHENNTDPCDNGNLCTKNDVCLDGQCQAGDDVTCSDSNVCTDDSCDPDAGCQFIANSAGCNDGDACTDNDTCADSACAGTPITCLDNDICTNDSCNPGSGCVFGVIPNCCGNHITEPPETCDDGNQQSGDGCSADCKSEKFSFQSSQVIDGKTVTCSSTETTGSYTLCNDLKAGGLFFPNGITCGPTWSGTNSSYSDTKGFCASLTGKSNISVYYQCEGTTTRSTWYNHNWGTTQDNGYTRHVKCFY